MCPGAQVFFRCPHIPSYPLSVRTTPAPRRVFNLWLFWALAWSGTPPSHQVSRSRATPCGGRSFLVLCATLFVAAAGRMGGRGKPVARSPPQVRLGVLVGSGNLSFFRRPTPSELPLVSPPPLGYTGGRAPRVHGRAGLSPPTPSVNKKSGVPKIKGAVAPSEYLPMPWGQESLGHRAPLFRCS